MATTLKTKIYSQDGKEAGDMTLPESVFGAAWNPDLVHEVVTSMQSNARAGTAHTKDRGEVRGGGKKPWRQKGTGRARHGSRRSPIWTGGGTTFGPRSEKDYSKKINRNARARALASVLSQKLRDEQVLLVDSFTFDAPKAALAKKALAALGGISGKEDIASKKQNAVLVVLASRDENTEKSLRNFGNVLVTHAKDVNPVELLTYKYVVVAKPEESIETFARRVATKVARKAATTTQ
ncbi:50S ribosomal protein L4 [Candidatus Kaiserbacteria bacterium]|nr:50S ribosomal protein L4 [Candidatus Kaiserbacteria bacterium]